MHQPCQKGLAPRERKQKDKITANNKPFFNKTHTSIGPVPSISPAFPDLDRRFASGSIKRMPKNVRIEQTLLNAFTPLSKSDICRLLPDVSPTTVEAVLGKLVSQGVVRKIGAGRNTKYLRK